MIPLEILVLAPSPTHPQDYGNRKRIFEVCNNLRARGARIHYLYYPAESDWREALPMDAYRAMTQAWDSFNLIPPTRPLHQASAGEDHGIDEWWDPAIGSYLTWLFAVKRFDAFIVNYTWLSKALEFAPKGVFRILDTHDRFSDRRALLEAQGLAKEFFHTTREQEAIALNRAELVWAIKDEEKAFFETLTDRPVVTLLHSEKDRPIARRRSAGDEGYLVAGCLGARNNINCTNVRNFVAEALPVFRKYVAPIKLRLAGSMCQDLAELGQVDGVELMGKLEDVADFYAGVDLVLIPMSFSTGLKIKTGEALAAHAALISHVHAFEGFPPGHPYHQLESFTEIAEACVELAFDATQLAQLRAASEVSQASLCEQVHKAMDASVAHIRGNTPRIVITLPVEALEENSFVAAHVEQTVGYLRYLAGVVFYCDFALTPERVRRLNERFSAIGPILVAPGQPLPEGSTYGQGDLTELARAYPVLALWLFSAPAELGSAGSELIRIPVYARTEILEQIAGGLQGSELAQALQRFRWVHLLGAHDVQLARMAGAIGRADQIRMPLWYSRLPRALERWTTGARRPEPGQPWRVLIMARDPGAALTLAVLKIVRAQAGAGCDALVLHIEDKGFVGAADGPSGGQPLSWMNLREVSADLSRLGPRPHLVLLLSPDEAAYEGVLEVCRRLDVPVLAPGAVTATATAGWFAFVQSIVRAFAPPGGARPGFREANASSFRYGRDAGWAHIWRTLTERRQLARWVGRHAG